MTWQANIHQGASCFSGQGISAHRRSLLTHRIGHPAPCGWSHSPPGTSHPLLTPAPRPSAGKFSSHLENKQQQRSASHQGFHASQLSPAVMKATKHSLAYLSLTVLWPQCQDPSSMWNHRVPPPLVGLIHPQEVTAPAWGTNLPPPSAGAAGPLALRGHSATTAEQHHLTNLLLTFNQLVTVD